MTFRDTSLNFVDESNTIPVNGRFVRPQDWEMGQVSKLIRLDLFMWSFVNVSLLLIDLQYFFVGFTEVLGTASISRQYTVGDSIPCYNCQV